MSKRTKKDIKTASAEHASTPGASGRQPADQTPPATLSAEPAVGKKRPSRRTSAKTAISAPASLLEPTAVAAPAAISAPIAVAESDASGFDDPELQSLLLQVDHMLTEMTQSKWLSSDWPSLEIDLGNNKK